MKKIYCVSVQLLLLLWFFLDMTGAFIGDKCLVTRSYKDDGLFFIIYLLALILFISREKIGKWVITIWTSLWFITQFLCHEWYTIFNEGCMGTLEGKIDYFKNTIQLVRVDGRYIPDLYHTVLHILILAVVITTILYIVKNKKRQERIIFRV